jgi:hypothetical protein
MPLRVRGGSSRSRSLLVLPYLTLPPPFSFSRAPNHPTPRVSTQARCDEFNDLKSIDKIATVQAKVDAVTGVMQKNIELALKNTDR